MLGSIAGCIAVDVVDILAKMRKPAASYEISCEGWRRDDLPRSFLRILLTHRVSGADLDEAIVRRAVDLSQEKYCSAMASLHPNVVVENAVVVNGPGIED